MTALSGIHFFNCETSLEDDEERELELHREKLEELTTNPEKYTETHEDSERLRAFTETHQRSPRESGASRSCLDRFVRELAGKLYALKT